ncbi:MAG: alpha-L-fucosidase [Clostridia bacterium]|nr:alpha-L-fucosidase [Clostridia bacterium]
MKKRQDSSFGLHFDFHSGPNNNVGATLREEDIRTICQTVKPDFIQIDCKGHPGWTSYPTKLGNATHGIVFDTLEMWRRVTKEEGVALYMHYSGVFDTKYCIDHPEDAVLNADGTTSQTATRCLGNYVDNLLIPQIKELAGVYGVDGIWIDGDCWACQIDYHPDTIAAFEKETGIDLCGKAPVSRNEKYYDEYLDFNRELFRRYVRHYTEEIHAEYPDFQIASNWGFTDHMPEAVTADVNYISGDLDPWNSLNAARYAGRAIAQQNMTWDLMAWNFRHFRSDKPQGLTKNPIQILQEAAEILSIGGGFQNYITQKADGSPRMLPISRMKEVGEFIRAREPYCFRGQTLHEAAILLSTYDRRRSSNAPFDRTGCQLIIGMTSLMCDCSFSTEIVCEHTLKGNYNNYKLIVIPEIITGLDKEMITDIIEYARGGGSLLLAGVNTCRIFSDYLPFTVDGTDRNSEWRWACHDQSRVGKLKNAHDIICNDSETVVWYGLEEDQTNTSGGIILNYGSGKIGLLAADIGGQYFDCAQYVHRDIIKAMCEKLYTPLVKVERSLGLLEINELIKDEKLYIQLINVNGQHANPSVATEDFIPPVLDITVSVALDSEPEKILLQPEGKSLDFNYTNGRAYINIDRLDIHSVIEIL